MKICVVSYAILGKGAGSIILSSFLKILEAMSNNIFVVSENFCPSEDINLNKIHVTNVHVYAKGGTKSIITKILKYIRYQIEISKKIIRLSKKIDVILMYGGSSLLIPNIISHLLRRRVCIFAQGPDYNVTRIMYPSKIGTFLYFIIKIIDQLNWRLADMIVVQSKSLVEYEGLGKLKNKVLTTGARFVDTEKFRIKINYSERDILIGYIGRFTKEKGIIEFANAMPVIHSLNPNIKFLIGGDGVLKDQILDYLNSRNIVEKTEITGWISTNNLPNYLNKLKLIILPSYTEGLPTTALEAMACGTPVLATPVGGVPDVITDGETGFIMVNNSPECIAENVVRALEHPDLERIVENARALVEREFTYEAAVERYRTILEGL
jgi:glycosyltransferase involved in cell wall biosynthesis